MSSSGLYLRTSYLTCTALFKVTSWKGKSVIKTWRKLLTTLFYYLFLILSSSQNTRIYGNNGKHVAEKGRNSHQSIICNVTTKTKGRDKTSQDIYHSREAVLLRTSDTSQENREPRDEKNTIEIPPDERSYGWQTINKSE